MSSSRAVALTPHSGTRSSAVRAIDVRVSRMTGGTLSLTYSVTGNLDRVRIPAAVQPRAADGLWQHTCCELFVRGGDGPGYHELNFSPSGEWAVYAFERYREGVPLAREGLDPRIRVRSTADKLELDAMIRLDHLACGYAHEMLVLGLSAVIEDTEGALAYWALAHAAGPPDFHHPEAFALRLNDD